VVPLFRDDFSLDLGWTRDQSWEVGPAQPSPPVWKFSSDPEFDHSSSGDNMVAGVLIGGLTVGGLHDFYYLTSPQIDLSGAEKPRLSFWRMLKSDYPPFMHNVVEAFDGDGWHTLWASPAGQLIDESEWVFADFDVTPYKNALFQFRIGYDVANSGAYSCPSWSVDDVVIVDAALIGEAPLCCTLSSDCQSVVPGAQSCTAGVCE